MAALLDSTETCLEGISPCQSIAAVLLDDHERCLHLQACDFFTSAPADGHQWDAYSSWNDTFDRLVHPSPDAGFVYTWLKSSQIATTNLTVFAIAGWTPCCIPMELGIVRDMNQIRAHDMQAFKITLQISNSDMPVTFNTFDVQGFEPNPEGGVGDAIGICNLTSRIAQFTWCGRAYEANMTDDMQSLFIDQSPSLSSAPALQGDDCLFNQSARRICQINQFFIINQRWLTWHASTCVPCSLACMARHGSQTPLRRWPAPGYDRRLQSI